MTTLLFNSNYLYILLPSGSQSSALCQPGATFALRCIYNYWPVDDLRQEWGVDDFPELTATWAASFLASPTPEDLIGVEDPRIKDGEMYWITLQPTKSPAQPLTVLCLADADCFFFGVATDQEETASLFTHSQSENAEALLPVVLKDITRIKTDEASDDETITARVVIHGESEAGWIKAIVKPVSV